MPHKVGKSMEEVRFEAAVASIEWLEGIYKKMPVGVPVRMSDKKMYELLGITTVGESQFSRARRMYTNLGILGFEVVYSRRDRAIMWTLKVPLAEAKAILQKYFDDGGSVQLGGEGKVARLSRKVGTPMRSTVAKTKAAAREVVTTEEVVEELAEELTKEAVRAEQDYNEPVLRRALDTGSYPPADDGVAIAAEKSPEEVRAIAGPEAAGPFDALRGLRKDEPTALVEAARQYAMREKTIEAKVKELESIGVPIEHEVLMSAIHFEPMPILEAVASLLPMFDGMTERLTKWNRENNELRAEIRALRSQIEPIRKERDSLKDANKRLADRNAALIAARPN